MVKRCETLNQDGTAAQLCPGLETVSSVLAGEFKILKDEMLAAVKEEFKTQLELTTGFAYEERHVLKCILGWAKKAKDEDNRVKIWAWALGASVLSSSLTWLLKGLPL